jgi:MoxR-like ATPase
LPWAHVGFVDEVFKANSAILNSLLTLMAERKFKCGVQNVQAPLVSLVGASNETPQEDDLGAMYDRFMVRKISAYVSDANVVNLLRPSTGANAGQTVISLKEWEDARKEVKTVTVSDAALEEVANLKAVMKHKGFTASDRRWRASIKLLQACAWLDGRSKIESDDLMVYSDVLWDDMKQAKTVADEVGKIINPAMQQLLEHIDEVDKLLNQFVNAPDEQERINAMAKINTHKAKLLKIKAGAKGDEAVKRIGEKVNAAVKKVMKF